MKKNMGLAVMLLAAILVGQRPHGPAKGWLFLEGGSFPVDAVVAQAFVKLAGGPDKKFVWIPTAADEERIDLSKLAVYTAAFGTKNFTVMHTRDHAVANSDQFLEALRRADGVWMSGGKPQNLWAAYHGTRVLEELAALLDRGGVVGGSSAGAMIQPAMMVLGAKRGPAKDVDFAPGFGLLTSSLALVHMEQRHDDQYLLEISKAQPELLCLGIDTATAIAVRGDRFDVVGRQHVRVVKDGQVIRLSAGDHFNMKSMITERTGFAVSQALAPDTVDPSVQTEN